MQLFSRFLQVACTRGKGTKWNLFLESAGDSAEKTARKR